MKKNSKTASGPFFSGINGVLARIVLVAIFILVVIGLFVNLSRVSFSRPVKVFPSEQRMPDRNSPAVSCGIKPGQAIA